MDPRDPAKQRILIAVTGASGSVYAERLVEVLLEQVGRIYLVMSSTAQKVMDHELSGTKEGGFSLREAAHGRVAEAHRSVLRVLNVDDLFAPVASGSSAPTAMVVLPCSMGSLARMAQGISGNLIERAADVCLKQRRPLLICPRETPLSLIHLRNMMALAEAGAQLVPTMPAFYQHPKTIEDLVDFQVGRVLELLGLGHELYPPWNRRMR